ncbi:MAG: AEC family transporter, partial [bacterium]
MIDNYLELSPIILTFLLGVILRRAGVVAKDDGGLLLKLVFYIALPSLILLSIPDVEVSVDLIALPVSAAIIIFVSFAVSSMVCRRFSQERGTIGTAVVGSTIMNTNFLYPFVLILYGTAGFARIVVFDFGNSLLVLTFVYYVACRFGSASVGSMGALRRLISSPPL